MSNIAWDVALEAVFCMIFRATLKIVLKAN